MNTSTLTVGRSTQAQTVTLRADARRLRERVARRAGLALIAWGRRQDEQRSYAANTDRRRNELVAARLQAAEFQRIALIAQPMI